ncbi:unnamed protein product (macronuclear) [Paramecium tetraurelia]|uniref:Protein kinase domain-containing protein n=1 Tax=Paramecium tetraurelia TaxID=5888 RepID=A0EFJ6_PARTE|nr:uncharacterized protein GSPATT00026410001 [Paramecium tetraurelia]CAK94087.1 unnamed protein product [Paramecium tetraurelia]|eukprot:XP_001461460.1 hypothetical protein (macronuclear) [Paramecium tetraurelia strain d4-2]
MNEDWTTKKVDKYVVVNKTLGQGAYGIVYRGFYQEDETKQVAVKTIKIATISDTPKMIELIKREIAILQKINHPNIVRLYDVARTNNYLYMFLEYCADGDLKDYMAKKEEKRLSELEAVIFIKHIVEGFKRLYKQKIIHRDIKPANILLHQGVAKITDFGFARVMDSEMNDPAYLSRLGSPLYMAPQILEGQPFSAKCDVWSVGVMFYELLYGRTPWSAENAYSLLENIKKQSLKFPPKPVRSQKIKELITLMLRVQEKDRISWEGVFEDPTIKIDEETIKENMKNILKEKDEISKSISLNKLYIDQNLVVGYLAKNPINTLENSNQQTLEASAEARSQSAKFSSQFDSDSNADIIMSNYKNEKKRRDAMLKYNNYFLFERNIAFFFNFVIQKIIKLQTKLQLANDNYFRLIYLIAKNQMVHLERVNQQLQRKDHDKFDKETWGRFLASQEYQKLISLISMDMKHSLDFYTEISKKCNIVQQEELVNGKATGPTSSLIKNFLSIQNNNFEANDTFHMLYRDIIVENLKNIKNLNSKETEINLLLLYLLICQNPYEEFKDINYDFNTFYEEIENLTLSEVQEKLQKKGQK